MIRHRPIRFSFIQANAATFLLFVATALVVGLSVWQDVLLDVGLLCLAVLTGLFALAVLLSRPVLFLYFLCFLIPFSQSIPTIDIAGRTLHVGFDTIVIGVILLGYLLHMLVRGKARFVGGRAGRALLIWWGWTLCTLVLGVVHYSGAARADAVIVFLRWSQYIPVFFLVLSTDLQPRQIKTFIALFAIAGILMAGVNLMEDLVIGVDRTLVRGTGLVVRGLFLEDAQPNYNVAAAYLAIVVLLLTPFVLGAKRWRKLLGTLMLLFLLAGIGVTTSRSGLLAAAAGFVYMGLFFYPHTFFCLSLLAVPLTIVGLSTLKDTLALKAWLQLRYIPQALPLLLGASFESLGLPLSAKLGVSRLARWGLGARLFAQSPLWGNGFYATRWSQGSEVRFFTVDNYFLEMAADSGLIGILVALLFLGAVYIAARRLFKLAGEDAVLRRFSIGYMATFVGLMVVSLTGSMFMSQKIWGAFVLLSALVCNQLHRQISRQKMAPALAAPSAGGS